MMGLKIGNEILTDRGQMGQVVDNKLEDRAWISPVLQEVRRFRSMNIHEHARLVQAIMLNFPEIYGDPTAPSPAASDNSASAPKPAASSSCFPSVETA
jgi:hypothetical protein